jgi:hypothetical protein
MDLEVDFSKYSGKVKIISAELKRIANDPEVVERGEELQRKLSSNKWI